MPKIDRVFTQHDPLTYQIIGCAMAVHRELGPGFREDTYQRALQESLATKNISFEAQKLFEVVNQEQTLIGYYIPDFLIDGKIVVEIKALKGLENSHIAQVIGYLAVTGYPIGLLINFGERSLTFRRILPPANIRDHHVNRQWLFVPDWLEPKKEE